MVKNVEGWFKIIKVYFIDFLLWNVIVFVLCNIFICGYIGISNFLRYMYIIENDEVFD